ncbi:MAG: extracellular solute-binding protein [Clostridia bacterium]|nr:extracellular solute-binding protein [Clostridia bacterium]
MKTTAKRITALFLVLLMTASLLASCSERKDKEAETADTYLGENVDLGLAENETLMDIIEVDGELRATVGVTNEEMTTKYGTEYGTPYKTEYRYYDMEFVEDTAKREPTASFHQIAQHYDPSLNLTIGGEPYLYTDENGVETSYGVRYQLYKDGEPIGDYINPRGANGYGRYTKYNARANLTMIEDAPFIWMDYTDFSFEIYIKDHFLQTTEINPDVVFSTYGLLELSGTPHVLIGGAQYDWSEEGSYFFAPQWEETRLIPLTAETKELSLEGTAIEGVPTGGAFNDGTYGYYMCGSELWRADGEIGARIADLIYNGVDSYSQVRAVRTMKDSCIMVVANGGLILLSESDSVTPEERNVYTLGVIDTGYLDGTNEIFSLIAAKFNSRNSNCKIVIKEYKDITKMNLALLSGDLDILAIANQFALNNYIKQGFLAPLEEVVPEFFEEGVLIENIVDATRVDGTCYYLPREFEIQGMVVECRLLEEGQTFETQKDYLDFVLKNDPGFFKFYEKNLLMMNIALTLDEWIDWDANTCHFDDGSFEDMLEFCNAGTTPEEWDHTALYYTDYFSFNGFKQYPYFEGLFTDVKAAKEYLAGFSDVDPEKLPIATNDVWARVLIPFPSSVYDGYEIWAEPFFAVVDKEESREAAREFMTWYFLENVVGEIAPDDPADDYPDCELKGIYKFSINQAECERYVGRNLTWDGEDKETRLPREQRWYEDTWKIIRQADHLQHNRNAITEVMNEEAYRYFAGDITAKQAAEYVQNRISLYLAEQG